MICATTVRASEHQHPGSPQRGRAAAVALLAALLLTTAGVGSAAARGTEYRTGFTAFKYKLSAGEAEVRGKLGSPKGACVKSRNVKVYRKQGGEKTRLGAATTDGAGKFAIDLPGGPLQDGKYYAKVTQRTIGESGDRSTCLERTSPALVLSSN
jgi:hypothetical protein